MVSPVNGRILRCFLPPAHVTIIISIRGWLWLEPTGIGYERSIGLGIPWKVMSQASVFSRRRHLLFLRHGCLRLMLFTFLYRQVQTRRALRLSAWTAYRTPPATGIESPDSAGTCNTTTRRS